MRSRLTKPPSGKLPFDAPEKPANMFVANVDGASRGNPGPASYAVILRGPDGATRFEVGKYLGRATNNVAEYYGLITALDYAAARKEAAELLACSRSRKNNDSLPAGSARSFPVR